MTSEEMKYVETLSENTAFRAANVVGDKIIKHITDTTITALASAQKELDSLRREHEMKIESMRTEREMKLAAMQQDRHAEIATHAATCPVKKDVEVLDKRLDAAMNTIKGTWAGVKTSWHIIVALAVFLASVAVFILDHWQILSCH